MLSRLIGRNKHEPFTPLILAGGMGERLSHLTGTDIPKQFWPHNGAPSLFQQTINRVQNRHLFYTPHICANIKHQPFIRTQCHSNHTTWYEPVARNTATAITISALHLYGKGRAQMIVLPSDHIISNTHEFHKTIAQAHHHMSTHQGHVLIGAPVRHTSPDLGYIQTNSFGNVTLFVEKPDTTKAVEMMNGHSKTYWNTGIVCLNIPLFLSELNIIAPDFLSQCIMAYQDPTVDTYNLINDTSFDRLYLEHATNLYCIEATFPWADVGMTPDYFTQQPKAIAS